MKNFRGRTYALGTVIDGEDSYLCDPIPVVFKERNIICDI